MRFDIHHHHHMDPEQRTLLLDAREGLIMISAEVQEMLDKARRSVVLVNSVHAGMTALRLQVQELNQRLAQIPVAQPATDDAPAVAGLSDEDRGAILEVTADLDRTITTLSQDIPTNVSTVVAATPVEAPVPDTQEEDAQAASQAKPLPGTGEAVEAPAPPPEAPAAPPEETKVDPSTTGAQPPNDAGSNQGFSA